MASLLLLISPVTELIGLLAIIITLLSVFNTFISDLEVGIELSEDGCPPSASYLLWGLSAVMLLMPLGFKSVKWSGIVNMVLSLEAFKSGGALKASALACKSLNGSNGP